MPDFSLFESIKNAKPRSYDPLPVGKYEAKVVSSEFKNAKSSNAPMIAIQFEIINNEEFERRRVFTNIVFTEKALDFAVEKLAALGYTDQVELAENIAGEGDPAIVCRQLLDQFAIITLEQREWNGKINNEVKRIEPLEQQNPLTSAPARPSAAPARPF